MSALDGAFNSSVNNVTLAGSTCASGANHDPDGDSDGSSITVTQP